MSKQSLYIFLFTVLGAMLGFFLHMIIEILYINYLVSDFETFSFGRSFEALVFLHGIFLFALVLALGYFGYRQGVFWWKIIYIEGRIGKFKKYFKKTI